MKKPTKRHRKESVQSKKWYPSHKFFYVLFSVAQPFLVGFSWNSNGIKASNKESTSKNEPTSVSEITFAYTIFAEKYYNPTTLSMWVVYKYIAVWKFNCI